MTLSPAAERLGVDQSTATEGDISRAYRRQTLQLHPDKSPGNPIRAAAEFVQLQRDRENLLRAFAARRHARRVAATALRRWRHELCGHVHGNRLHGSWLWSCQRDRQPPQERLLCIAATTTHETYSLGGLMWLSAAGCVDWAEVR
jgi:hypothetical protein